MNRDRPNIVQELPESVAQMKRAQVDPYTRFRFPQSGLQVSTWDYPNPNLWTCAEFPYAP